MTVLSDELTNDPLVRGYSAMTNTEAAASLNVEDRIRIRGQMTGDEIFQQTDGAEFNSLTDLNKQLWLAFCGRDIVDPGASANAAFVQFVFGTGSATVTALVAARQETVSRGVELGLGFVGEGDVEDARIV